MVVTNYVWDVVNDSYLMEKDEDDVTQMVYTNRPDTYGELISQRRNSSGQWSVEYYHFDGLGSTSNISDINEYVPETYIYDAFGTRVSSNSFIPNFLWVGQLGYYWDSVLADYYVRARYYDPAIARWLSRNMLELTQAPHLYLDLAESDSNDYRYATNKPALSVDHLKLEISGITGPCNIWIYAGHGIWPWILGEDPAVGEFREAHDTLNDDIVTGCGNYLTYVGCEGAKLNQGVTEGREVPGYPGVKGPASWGIMLPEVKKALTAARKLQKKLCNNRKKFSDDGQPERYACGAAMQRCDDVTVHVFCDTDMKVLMDKGIYQRRLFPGGSVVSSKKVRGLPTRESKSICSLKEKLACIKKKQAEVQYADRK